MVTSSSPTLYDSPHLRDSPDDIGSGASPRSGGRSRQQRPAQRSYPDDIEDDIGPPLVANTHSPGGRQSRDWHRETRRVSNAHQLPPLFPRGHARHNSGGGSPQDEIDMADLHHPHSPQDPFVDQEDIRGAPAPPPEPISRSRSRRDSSYGRELRDEPRRARSQSRNRRHSRSITSNASNVSRGPPRYGHSRTPSRTQQLRRLSENYEEAYEIQQGGGATTPRTPRTARASVRGGEPFPPMPDHRMTMSPAEEDLDDPRVRVLLEALRITTSQENAPPAPETVRGSTHIDMRTRDNSHAERGFSPNEKATEDTWYSESQGATQISEKESSSPNEFDKNIVDWDGPDDPACPSNWPMMQKYKTSLILSMFSFIAPFSATMVGPAIDVIGAELNISAGTDQRLIMGMQVLAAGIGPVFIAPMIEYFGRAPIIRYAHLWHMIWNTACGFATTGPQLLAFRFIGGLGASAPQIIPPGLTADLYPAPIGGRGDAVHAYLPFLGSAIAPIFGAAIAEYGDWRWIFWGTSIFSTVAIALAFLFLDETMHPILLAAKCERLKASTGNQALHTPYQVPGQTKKEWMMKKIALPYVMLVCHPTVQLAFGYRAYLFGIMYLFISTFDRNFVTRYGMDKFGASLNILSLGAGFLLGLHLSRYCIDGWSAYFRKKHNTDGHRPEWRLPVNAGAAILIPPALILYGWALEKRMHYVVPDIAAFFLAIGLILGFFSLQPYVTESYGAEYASSAHAAGTFMQHIAEFAFPLFGPPIFADLGQGWGNTLIAVVTLSIAILMPLVLWHFGPALRRLSSKGLPVEASARR